jgi:1-acyl-sn-glycerol-3-phosphate acyltransferase
MLAAEKYREVAIFRWLAKQLNAIFIDRYNADLVATRAALKRLKEGWVLVMAPEGTRSPDGALQEGWPGASYLAVRAGVPIIPVAVLGTADAEVMANLRRLRRTQVEVRVGAPFRLPPLDGRDREAQLKGFTDEIMLHIAALLPAERRGVYRDHPGLPALLEQELSQRNMV